MATSEKNAVVAELAELFRTSTAAVLTEYRGLTVAELKELRRALGENATYAVVKNTLTEIAADQAGVDAFKGKMTGPSAIALAAVHGRNEYPSVCMSESERMPGYRNRSHVPPRRGRPSKIAYRLFRHIV